MTMTEEQEIAAKIGDLGEQIKAAKAEKKPKEEWEPILTEMLAVKVSLHTQTGPATSTGNTCTVVCSSLFALS